MPKNSHEIRDPIHVFVRLSSDERKVLDSRPFQRLRHIHQLALTYLVYPGATHKRFEHSLGVMELASRVFDVVTRNASDEVKRELPDINDNFKREYWLRALRMAALVHDIGHLPFSHAAEKELLPDGWTHETLTKELILSNELLPIWEEIRIRSEDVVKLALGPREYPEGEFSRLESILSEIIVGSAFGVDRMDYLLRDSHHTGVAYGKFDHYRLIDTLRILKLPPPDEEESSNQYSLGMEDGGMQSAEALMLARYFIYTQVYFHPIRRIYDIHLKDFLTEWLPSTGYPVDIEKHLRISDTEVLAAMREADVDHSLPGHTHARRIIRRIHFKKVYSRDPEHTAVNPEAGRAIFKAACLEFGEDKLRHDRYTEKEGKPIFPVEFNGVVRWSWERSEILNRLPLVNTDYVFADRAAAPQVKRWIESNIKELIQPKEEGFGDG